MSAVNELMERKKNGFDFGILGRAILELAERVKALEDAHISTSYTYADGAKQLSDHLAKASQPKPAPAPDLDAKISKAANDLWVSSHNVQDVEAHLRAFAAELGVE